MRTIEAAITIRVTTAAGTNASRIGESHRYEGVTWRNSVDACDSDGEGRVFFDCDSEESASYLEEQLESDENVVVYERS